MTSLDTNCLLRYLLMDVPEHTLPVMRIIDSGEPLSVSDVALIEMIFVLEKVRRIDRALIQKALQALFTLSNLVCDRSLFEDVLAIYVQHPKLSAVDCYLACVAQREGIAPLLTFDKALAKQMPSTQLITTDTINVL
ncbi:MAG: PIN domain-containing protein [Coriobacteriia bacterium]|nr:PIN domain-containing protein [Coriobacteriia bacterium]